MSKSYLVTVIKLLFCCLYFNNTFSQQAPTFIFKNDFDRLGSSPIEKELARRMGITRIEEYRENITDNKSNAKRKGCRTLLYNSVGCLVRIEMKGCADTITNSLVNYSYDSLNRLIVEEQLFNIHKEKQITCVVRYSYLGDSIIEANYYWKSRDEKFADRDSTREIQYFDANKKLIKYIGLRKDKTAYITIEYEYDGEGRPSALNYIYNDSSLSHKNIYQYVATKRGSKLIVKQIGSSNNNGITECIFNNKGQCIECNLNWENLGLRTKHKYEYNDDGTMLSNTRINNATVITKYTYFK